MNNKLTKYKNEYRNNYRKEHYIRKEVCFKLEEWQELEKILKKENKSLKLLIIEKILNNIKK